MLTTKLEIRLVCGKVFSVGYHSFS